MRTHIQQYEDTYSSIAATQCSMKRLERARERETERERARERERERKERREERALLYLIYY
jgi:hypothetical protein